MKRLQKIDPNPRGGIWLAAGLVTGLVVPAVLRLTGHVWPVWLSIAGGLVVLSLLVVLTVEKHQDSGKTPYHEAGLPDMPPFDPEKQEAVIRSSVCTGEKVAGFRNRDDGRFTEVMLITSPADEERFRRMYGIVSVKTIY